MEKQHHEGLLSLGWNAEKQDGINKIVTKNHTSGTIDIIHGNNMDFLRWCREQMLWHYFHVGIVDPPYGISVGDMKLGATANSKPREYEMGKWDGAVPTLEYWFLLDYVCRELIMWGGNYFTSTNCNIYEVTYIDGTKKYLQDILKAKEFGTVKDIIFSSGAKAGRGFYVWDKQNNGMSFADCELATTTMEFSARVVPKSRSLSKTEGDKRHPTHKPAYLYEYLHLQHDLRGKKVLDTHGGSFSHAQAAMRSQVKLTIMDREESYFNSGISAFEDSPNSKIQTLF